MNAVGIDVSKGKSMITVIQPLGKMIVKPYEVSHTTNELEKLSALLKGLDGETRVIMEHTGIYYQPIAKYLHEAGLFVSAVNPKKMHGYDKDALRRVKTDKVDAKKIAEYGLAKWHELREYDPQDDTRQMLKSYSRQYSTYSRIKTNLKNNLTALLEQTFPGISGIFKSPTKDNGHDKWVDFAETFWHIECVNRVNNTKFHDKYRKWCHKYHYNYDEAKAAKIYEISQKHIATMPYGELTHNLIRVAVLQINTIAESQAEILHSMQAMAQSMPEYPVVIEMSGVGENLAAQLIAEIGDIMRYDRKQSLSGYVGVDSPPRQSGHYNIKGKHVTKCGSPQIRRILFLVMNILLQRKPDDQVYHFLDRKRSEGKPYLVYMVAGSNKFLKVYYGRVKEHLLKLNS